MLDRRYSKSKGTEACGNVNRSEQLDYVANNGRWNWKGKEVVNAGLRALAFLQRQIRGLGEGLGGMGSAVRAHPCHSLVP